MTKSESEKLRLGNPGILPDLVAVNDRDVQRLRAAIGEHYGFTATLTYCRDLIAFVDSLKAGPHVA